MSDLALIKLRHYFKHSFENAVKNTPLEAYLDALKVSAPHLHSLLEKLHAFYPLTLGLDESSLSPTQLAIEACMNADRERTYPLASEAAARDYLTPFLHVYFDFLAYSPKSITDKMPTRWDCTEQRLEDWSTRNGVRLAYLAHTQHTSPSVLSNYERGMLVARAAFGALQYPPLSDEIAMRTRKASTKLFELEFLKHCPYSVRLQVNRAAMTHSGIAHVCNRLYQQFGAIPLKGGSFTDEIVERALQAWDDSLANNNIPVAYRDFIDSLLKSLDTLFCARVTGYTDEGCYAWLPHGQSLYEWSETLGIERVSIEWGALTKTNFELTQYRLSIMRLLLRRVDLTLWGVPLPGDTNVDIAV